MFFFYLGEGRRRPRPVNYSKASGVSIVACAGFRLAQGVVFILTKETTKIHSLHGARVYLNHLTRPHSTTWSYPRSKARWHKILQGNIRLIKVPEQSVPAISMLTLRSLMQFLATTHRQPTLTRHAGHDSRVVTMHFSSHYRSTVSEEVGHRAPAR